MEALDQLDQVLEHRRHEEIESLRAEKKALVVSLIAVIALGVLL